MNALIPLVLMVLFSACSSRATDSKYTLEAADAAYNQFDLQQSGDILEAMLLENTLPDTLRCEALRRLAHHHWKYYQDYDAAIARLDEANAVGNSRFDTWMLISRIQRESLHFQQGLKAALEAENVARSPHQATQARIEYAQTVYELSVNLLENNKSPDTRLLSKTSGVLSSLLQSEAGMPQPSRLLLGISLLNNDGAQVMKAWQSYFHVRDPEDAPSCLSESARKLSQVCESWQGQQLNPTQQEMLIEALSASRFYEFIPVLVKGGLHPVSKYSGSTTHIIAYAEYLQEVKRVTNEYYRSIALGQADESSYIQWLEDRRKELWNQLSFLSSKEYSESAFWLETEKHFGAKGFNGSTGNYNGYVLCLGHIVNQENATIVQYGYKPELLFTQIDMMVSNGYSSWFWEDRAIGGWATGNEIIQVREAYLHGPFTAWKIVTDSLERKKTKAIIDDFLTQPHADELKQAEGLATKLRFDALNDLYQKISSTGAAGQDLKLAFLSAYQNYRKEASILAHEGRHSIERAYMPQAFENWSSEEREFHAKLSQIIFAPEPRLELADMLQAAGTSGHSAANKRMAQVAVQWIKNNQQKVRGYSPDKSGFSQIHLLAPHQLRECYRQADPLARD